MAVSFSQLFRGMCGGSFGGVKGFAVYIEEDQAFIVDVVLYRVPNPAVSQCKQALFIYLLHTGKKDNVRGKDGAASEGRGGGP